MLSPFSGAETAGLGTEKNALGFIGLLPGIPGWNRDLKKGTDGEGMRGRVLSARLMVKGPLTIAHFCNRSLFHLLNSFLNQLISLVILVEYLEIFDNHCTRVRE